MTTITSKQNVVLDVVRRKGQVEGIYALAKLVKRPYRRVFDHVRQLQKEGHLDIESTVTRGRRTTLIRPAQTVKAQPQLSYNRVWSSPVSGVSDDVFIASVIAEPTLQDLIACCKHYGIERVRKIFHAMLDHNELSVITQKSVGRMLGNIEIGFARAA